MRDLLRVGCSFERAGLALLLEKPVFDTLTPIGSCRPDFLLEARSRSTGETREIIVEAMGSTDETYLAAKAVTHPRMQQIAQVLCVSPDDVEEARIAPLVRKAFRSEEHTSELQSLMRNSYAVFCLKKTSTSLAD